MGNQCCDMKPFMDICIHNAQKLSEDKPVQRCLITNFFRVQELRAEDAASSSTRTACFSHEEMKERELDTGPYIAFLQFITKVMVPHSTYTRYVQKNPTNR